MLIRHFKFKINIIALIRSFTALFISFLFVAIKKKRNEPKKRKKRIVPLLFRYSIEKVGALLQKSGDLPPSFSIFNRKSGVLPEPPLPSALIISILNSIVLKPEVEF